MDSYEGRAGEPLTLHKYLYAHGNPVMNIDPSGHLVGGVTEVTTSIGISLAMTTMLTYQVLAPAYYRAQETSLKTELELIRNTCPIGQCDRFVKEAADLLKRKGRREGADWKIIIYKNNPGQPVGDYIVAKEGFGIYGDGKTAISENGFHAGIIVTLKSELMRELVSDNNVLLVSRSQRENGYLLAGRIGGPFGPLHELTLRRSADNGLGTIKVISLGDLISLNY